MSNQASSLAPDWIPLLQRPRIPASFMVQQQPFNSNLCISLWSSNLRERREINNKETHNSFPDMVCVRERKREGDKEKDTQTELREIDRKTETKGKTERAIKDGLSIYAELVCNLWCVVIWLLNHIQFFATPWAAACQASLSFHYLLEFAQAYVHWVNDTI